MPLPLDSSSRVDPNETWIEVGRVGRPHGVAGLVRLQLFNRDSDFFDEPRDLRALLPGRPARMVRLVELRPVPAGFIARFAGVADRDAAATLTNALLSIARSALPEPEPDEFYLHEVVGAEVFDAASGARVGVVAGLIATHTDLLEIRLDSGGNALVPVDSEAVESLGREPGRVVVRDIEDWRSE